MINRIVRGLAVVLLVGTASLTAVTGTASARPGTESDAIIRAAHFSPTTPGVDVYLNPFSGGASRLWLSGVAYGAVSPYQVLTPGLYTVAMRTHGAPSSSPAVLSWTLDARAGNAYTVAGVGSGASVRGLVLHDDLATPPSGQGRVRVIQAASRAPTATVSATHGPVIARDAAFATTTTYATVPAGTWPVQAVAAGSPGLRAARSVTVRSGSVTSLLLLDAKSSGIVLRTVLDSSAAAQAPRGSVPAGGGGTAAVPAGAPSSGLGVPVLAGLLAATLVALTGTGLGRRRARRSPGAHAG